MFKNTKIKKMPMRKILINEVIKVIPKLCFEPRKTKLNLSLPCTLFSRC